MSAPTPKLLLNPPGVEQAYLEALQRNFGGWGGRNEFRWWFGRRIGGPSADLMVLVEGGDTLVAGAAVSYRQVDLGGGAGKVLAGVITGAWTATQYRRRGCFTELIERARGVAADRGAALLLAFSPNHPSSRTPLERASFGEASAWHLGGEAQGRPPDRRAPRPAPADLHRWFHDHRIGAGFDYPSVDLFADQALLNDPNTRVAEAPGGLWGILAAEQAGGGVQAVISEQLAPHPTAVATALHVWGLPSYTTDPGVARKLRGAAETFIFGIAVSGAPPPPWPIRWSLHRMDRV